MHRVPISATVMSQMTPALCYCTAEIMVIDATEIDQSWSTSTLPHRYRMSTLDEIAKEKQRVSAALARVDAQREQLSGQLSELKAAERVLARYSTDTQARRTASRKTPPSASEAAGQVQSVRRRRPRTAKSARGERGSPGLGDQILALATGKTQQEIAAA